MKSNLEKTNEKLIEILSSEKGYFGRIFTWGQRPTKYEFIGYEPTEDFYPTLEKMTPEEQRNLVNIMNYFEMHICPLRNLLEIDKKDGLDKFYSEIAWSHFATVVMFGMLEIAVKGKRGVQLDEKGKKMKKFMEDNLSDKIKESITKRYKTDKIFGYKKEIKSFYDVIDHMWSQIRSGFIHDAGIESKGLEWHSLEGIGTKENPITIKSDVPMQEWLQVTWQAILNSYRYKGSLELPKYKR